MSVYRRSSTTTSTKPHYQCPTLSNDDLASIHSNSQESTVTALDDQNDDIAVINENISSDTIDLEQQQRKPIEKLGTHQSLNEPYCIFSKRKKLLIVIICCLTGIVSPLSANIYFPALDAIRSDLNTTTELINLTVTVYMIFQGLSPSFWGSLADLWGRRPVYLSTLLVYMGSCIGLALSPTYYVLLILRMLQAFGSSSVIAIGAGVVGDIATPAERGGYFGLFSMGQMLGPVIGPVLGGIISQYLSWRWIFWILLIIGGAFFTAILFLLPETLRSLVGNGSGYANPTPSQWLQQKRKQHTRSVKGDAHEKQQYTASMAYNSERDDDSSTIHGGDEDDDDSNYYNQPERLEQQPTATKNKMRSRFLQIPNVTKPFLYLLEKDIFCALIYNAIHYATYYCYLTSTTSQFILLYNMNQIQIGLCFLCQGIGCIIGSFVTGKVLDRDFRVVAQASGHANATRGKLPVDFPIFKARLRSMWIVSGLIQIITLFYGWMLHIHAHLAVVLVLQFIVGFSNTSMFNIFQTLAVDLFPGKSATITASNNLVRCLLGAVASVAIEPGIKGVGAGWCFTIIGLICVASNALVPVLFKYGPRWRRERLEKLARKAKQRM